MNKQKLIEQIRKKKSFLCVGLDVDLEKIPSHLLKTEDPVFEFNKAIIDATADYCIAFKPNSAFYECYGLSGWQALEKTINYINSNYPNHFTIADAKRGDIGNTSERYAKAFLENLNFDAITVAPYMGEDSVKPFMAYKNKWVIVLGLTSNKGALDFQTLSLNQLTAGEERKLYEKVVQTCSTWGTTENMMFVIGATQASMLKKIRKIIPDHFLLVPGVGAQGGSLKEVVEFGMNANVGLIVNASRSILYASKDENFASAAAKEAQALQQEMALFL